MPTPEVKRPERTLPVAEGCKALVQAIMSGDEELVNLCRRTLIKECALRPNNADSYVGRRVTKRVLRLLEENGPQGEDACRVIRLLEITRGRRLTGRKFQRAEAIKNAKLSYLPAGGFGSAMSTPNLVHMVA